jgi:hypothetical protein
MNNINQTSAGGLISGNKKYLFGDIHLTTPKENAEIISTIKNGKIMDWDAYEKMLTDMY